MAQKKKRTKFHTKHVRQVPGTVIYTGEKVKKHLRIESLKYNKESVEDTILLSLEDSIQKTPDKVTWINVDGLHFVEEIESLGHKYNIHPLVLEDIANTSQRPKIDEYEDYLFIVLKMLHYDENERIISEQVSFILKKNHVFTFQEAEGDVFEEVRQRIRHNKGRIRLQNSDYLLYALMDAVVDNYYAIIETLGNKIEDLETEIFEGNPRETINQDIQNLKREILRLRRAIFPLKEVVNHIVKTEHHLISKFTINYFRDVYDHLVQVSDNIDFYRDMMIGLMEMYMSGISNKMNEVMKVLTIMSSIFIPMTFIAGIYGMNFSNMPELHFKYGYFIILGLMVLLCIGMLIFFRKRKWL